MGADDEQMSFDDELAAFLAEAGHDDGARLGAGGADPYRVERTLKESAYEVTELVVRGDVAGGGAEEGAGSNGAPARRYVRKRIRFDAHMGSAYEKLFGVQQAGARLAHVPRIYECVRTESELVVVMEQVCGESLGSLVEREGAGSALACAVFPKICGAVSELHEQLDPPLIHRDLKSSNIIIADGSDERALGAARAAGEPVIIDFGIARTWREGAESDTVRFGTRGYAAPEQFGFGQTSVRSDVYALGMVLYFCWTGREPRSGLDAGDLAAAGVPQDVADVILHATAFDPAARYGSAAELDQAFRAAPSTEEGGDGAGGVAVSAAIGSAAASSPGRAVPSTEAPAPVAVPIPAIDSPSIGSTATGADVASAGVSYSDMGAAAGASPRYDSAGFAAAPAGTGTGPASDRRDGASDAHTGLKGLVSRIPAWVGRVWNVVVICTWVFFAYNCVLCIVEPVGSDVSRSIWFRILEYAFMILAFVTATCWLVLDKRRLRAHLLGPQGITPGMEHVACAVLVGISIAALLVTSLSGMG